MITDITPVVLTKDEAHNLRRILDSLRAFPRVVIVDSGSADASEQIARSYSNVVWYSRPFDNFGGQWTFAFHDTSIDTPYLLALDADMALPAAFLGELEASFNHQFTVGVVGFDYRILGDPIAYSLYPAQARLFRKDSVVAASEGHKHVFQVSGPTYHFRTKVMHDDRKPIDRWLSNQLDYAAREQRRISDSGSTSWKDRLRGAGLMPLISGLLGYITSGGPFFGRAARIYALERMLFECLLSLRLSYDGEALVLENTEDSVPASAGHSK